MGQPPRPTTSWPQRCARVRSPRLFRKEDEQHVVLLMPGVAQPKPSNPWVNLLLFVLTVLSVIFAGALYSYDGYQCRKHAGAASCCRYCQTCRRAAIRGQPAGDPAGA